MEGGGFGFPFGGDPDEIMRGLREFAEQQAESVQEAQREQFATLTLSIGGNKLFPTMKVHRRLTQGEDDNVWSFYKMIKARLENTQRAASH